MGASTRRIGMDISQRHKVGCGSFWTGASAHLQ
ncbi:hypothetical protein V6Z12_A06G043700 [Gossypium hirsutum]